MPRAFDAETRNGGITQTCLSLYSIILPLNLNACSIYCHAENNSLTAVPLFERMAALINKCHISERHQFSSLV